MPKNIRKWQPILGTEIPGSWKIQKTGVKTVKKPGICASNSFRYLQILNPWKTGKKCRKYPKIVIKTAEIPGYKKIFQNGNLNCLKSRHFCLLKKLKILTFEGNLLLPLDFFCKADCRYWLNYICFLKVISGNMPPPRKSVFFLQLHL